MRCFRLILLLVAVCVLAAGCGRNAEVEHQAYALMLGIDRLSNGDIQLTIRVPRIEGAKSGESSGSGGESYLIVSASGESYARALESLRWRVERVLNLSQLKLIVVSRSLASDETFREIIDDAAMTRHLYTTAGFVVCEDSAREFIAEPDAMLGNRMSGEISAVFSHYASRGYITKSTFADLYYDTHSYYSDPVGIWGYTGGGNGSEVSAASDVSEESGSGNGEENQKQGSRHYLGAAVFRDGLLTARFDAEETLCLNLLSGKVGNFTYLSNGRAYSLSSVAAPRCGVAFTNDGVRLSLGVRLGSDEYIDDAARRTLERDVAERLVGFVRECQRLGVEPFGFARRAVWHFPTLEDWIAYDWRANFMRAPVALDVRVTCPSP